MGWSPYTALRILFISEKSNNYLAAYFISIMRKSWRQLVFKKTQGFLSDDDCGKTAVTQAR
jgi:hypothetical protein